MARGGKREGAGAPKGKTQQRSLEKDAVMKEFRQRVMKQVDPLFNAQYAKAVGSVMVFRVDEEELENGKTKKVHVHITDPEEIKQVLDEHEGSAGIVGQSFYFVTDVLPDSKAIDSMLDRTFGKAQQSVEITDASADKVNQLARAVFSDLLTEMKWNEDKARDFVADRYGIDKAELTAETIH
jgi:hypothetical protein